LLTKLKEIKISRSIVIDDSNSLDLGTPTKFSSFFLRIVIFLSFKRVSLIISFFFSTTNPVYKYDFSLKSLITESKSL
jgi:hypothetical protein